MTRPHDLARLLLCRQGYFCSFCILPLTKCKVIFKPLIYISPRHSPPIPATWLTIRAGIRLKRNLSTQKQIGSAHVILLVHRFEGGG